MTDALRVLNMVCSGIVTGTYVFEMLVVIPALATVPAETSARVHRLLFERFPNRYMPPLGIAAGVFALAVLLSDDELSGTASALYAAGFSCWTVAGFLTFGFSRKLDERISGWAKTEAVPPEYEQARRSWNRLMLVRGLFGVAGFICFCAASVAA